MESTSPPSSARTPLRSRLRSLRPGARLLVFLAYSLLLFGLGYLAKRERWIPVRATIDALENLPVRAKAHLEGPAPAGIAFALTGSDLLQLGAQRDRAFEKELLIATARDFVPATLRHGDAAMTVEMRLKGDSLDHLEGNKWSFRVRVRDGNALFGMRQFSLHHPKTRNYLYEWLFHRALERAGLIGLRYEFLTVTLNGTDLGIYALEEHFDRRLIEHSGLPPGPIVRFNEDLLWQESAQQKHSRDYNIFGSYLAAEVDTFQTGEISSDPEAAALHERAVRLLEAFRRGDLRSSEVFDLDRVTTFFALVDLLGAQHSINWSNMRFYYNPITSRLEAIGFDGDAGKRIRQITPQLTPLVDPRFIERLFADLVFYEEYLRKLRAFSEPSYVTLLLEELDQQLRENQLILLREFPDFEFSPTRLSDNATFIRSVLDPTQAVHAYLSARSDEALELQVGNVQSIPVELLGVSEDGSEVHPVVDRVFLPRRAVFHVEPPIYGKITSSRHIEYETVKVPLPARLDGSSRPARELTVHYRLLGEEGSRTAPVFPTALFRGDLGDDLPFQTSTLDGFDFLRADPSTGRILVPPGDWVLERDLVIPAGYRVIAGEGTRLDLRDGAAILSRSPFEFVGAPERPIVVGSTDGSGGGIVFLDTPEPSVFTNVLFENLTGPARDGWNLTAAVTFHKSPVGFSGSTFSRMRAGDALNIIGAEFSLEEVVFREIAADALDIDFSRGRLNNGVFTAIGRDAITASGATVEIDRILITDAGDRGVCAGEHSRVFLDRAEIRKAYVALAAKNLSHLTARTLQMIDSHHGIVAYSERPEYGPSVLDLEDVSFDNVARTYLLEPGSRVTVDSLPTSAEQERVLEMLYGGRGAVRATLD